VAIVEGGSVDIGEGVVVTLTEGQLVVDGSASLLSGLIAGESDAVAFTYTATDSAGASVTANVDVVFNGEGTGKALGDDFAQTDVGAPVTVDVA